MASTYDFIIVGGGTSGSVVASRLANSKSAPSVLLLEAGGNNDSPAVRSISLRHTAAFTETALNWGYKSTPQSHLNGTVIDCSRGKGLGGSSAINFSAWLVGDKEDFNEWAGLVGDECWKWEGKGGVKERFRKIEKLHCEPDEESAKFLDFEALKTHSREGKVDLTFSKIWNSSEIRAFAAAREFGIPINGDLNSGNPLGFGTGPASYYQDLRVSSSSAYLQDAPSNLKILTGTIITKVLFDSSSSGTPRATGVQTANGSIFHAKQEIIISAGALDSPKILLLSGVGPANELEALDIPVIHSSPYVGQNLRDHCNVTCTILLKGPSPGGPPSFNSPMAWISSPAIKASPEFAALDEQTKAFLTKVSSYELIVSARKLPHLRIPENAAIVNFHTLLMNGQSQGLLKLSSSDPLAPPLIDTQTLSHPYDKAAAIQSLRETLAYSRTPVFADVTERVLEGPEGDGDEELWRFWQKAAGSTWHFAGTCKMGRDAEAVVDSEFRVYGLTGLRVVDMSIAPVVPNNHVQSTAYLIGETAAEKIIMEYDLD